MPTATNSSYVNIGGLTIQSSLSRAASGQISHQLELAAGKAGTLTTRTDDDTGEATLSAGHGLQENDIVDVYWEGGVRYGMTVGVVVGTVVPIDQGAGDVLASQGSDLVVCKVTVVDTDFDGDLIEMIAAHATKRGHLAFRDSGGVVLKAVELVAEEMWFWADDTDITNPLSGNPVDNIRVSNGDSAAASTLKIAVLYDSQE